MEKTDIIDALLDVYKKKMPKQVYLIKNVERYVEVSDAVNAIIEMAQSCDEDVEIHAAPDDLVGTSLELVIKADLFTVDYIDKFCDALKKANAFEVLPLTDGRITLGITFQNVWKPAPPRK